MKPKAPETIDEQAEFGYFLDDLKFDIKLSYGLISLLLNVYYCYAYFPQTKTLVFALLDWNSPPHPVTFVDWCASIQFAFYFGTLVGHYYRPELERLILVHGSYVVNGAIWSAWWFLGMQSIKVPGWASIEGKAVLQRDSWSYLYVPILHWWTFLILRRNSLGVYVWDTENRLMHDDKAREVGDTGPDDGPELKASTTGAVLRKPSRLFGMPLYTCYQLWAYLAPVLPLLGWDMVLKPFGPSDLDVWPGTIKVLMVAASATWALKIFYTFLHFQCQCIVWREPFRRGLLINSYGRHLRLGIIYR
ncbi:hypothetical protein BC832DRAFT_541822 [Gaertneriomyces semiglobifer]|nr:hypothetical protein BC832DRAFT_541822 [Gaertneriomyces semiglobifer]